MSQSARKRKTPSHAMLPVSTCMHTLGAKVVVLLYQIRSSVVKGHEEGMDGV